MDTEGLGDDDGDSRGEPSPRRKDKGKDKPKKARQGGWGDASTEKAPKKGFGVSKFSADDDDGPSSGRGGGRGRDDSSDDGDMPVIPDLDDNNDEDDMTAQIAAPPSLKVGRVQTINELDRDLQKFSGFYSAMDEADRNMNLKLLTKALAPQEDIQEDDKPWVWDRLFTEVSSALQAEWTENDGPEKKENEFTAAEGAVTEGKGAAASTAAKAVKPLQRRQTDTNL